jgi:hypothetical protein
VIFGFERDAQLPEFRFRSEPPIRRKSANDNKPAADQINHHNGARRRRTWRAGGTACRQVGAPAIPAQLIERAALVEILSA